jgi:hypothetical protein
MGFIRNIVKRFLNVFRHDHAEEKNTGTLVENEKKIPNMSVRYVPPAAHELEILEQELDETEREYNKCCAIVRRSGKYRVYKKYVKRRNECFEYLCECYARIALKELEAEGRHGKK